MKSEYKRWVQRNRSKRGFGYRVKTYGAKAVGRLFILLILAGSVILLLSGAVTLYEMKAGNPLGAPNIGNPTSSISVTSASRYVTASTQDSSSSPTSSQLSVGVSNGNIPPNFPINFVNGTTSNFYSFLGRPTLLWFITTWCSSCQQGGQMLNTQYYQELYSKGVVIITVELYNDLGQNGPNLTQFANNYGGGTNKPMWYYGNSNQTTTYTFDPKAALDVYFAINSQGGIVEQGIGLPNALPTLSSDTSWFQS